MAGDNSTLIFGGLMIILFIAIAYKVYKSTEPGAQGLEGVVSAGGFDRSKIVNTQTTTDPATGAKTVTQTDANGQKLVTTTDAAGKTTTAVKAPDDTTLAKDDETVLDKVQKEAPKMMEMLALNMGRDFAIVFGAKLALTLSREITQSGVRTGLRDTARLVQKEGADYAMKWMGYVSKESIAVSEKLAAKSTVAEAARVASKEVLENAEKKATAGMAEGAAKEAAKKAATPSKAAPAASTPTAAAKAAAAAPAVEATPFSPPGKGKGKGGRTPGKGGRTPVAKGKVGKPTPKKGGRTPGKNTPGRKAGKR